MIDPVDDAKELKKPIPIVTVAFIIVVGGLGYMAGAAQTKLQMQDDHFKQEVENIYKYIDQEHEFAIEEISGLRNDMDKEDVHLQEDIDDVESKIGRKHDQQQIVIDELEERVKELEKPNSDK